MASKQKLIRENEIIDHKLGSSKKDDENQDYVANFYTKKDRPSHQPQPKPALEKKPAP